MIIVMSDSTLRVTGFYLVNADTDMAGRYLDNGDTVDLAQDGVNLNICVDIITIDNNNNENIVSKVIMSINGREYPPHQQAPFCLAGDTGGDFDAVPELREPGNVLVTATPYYTTEEGLFGIVWGSEDVAGETARLSLSLVDGNDDGNNNNDNGDDDDGMGVETADPASLEPQPTWAPTALLSVPSVVILKTPAPTFPPTPIPTPMPVETITAEPTRKPTARPTARPTASPPLVTTTNMPSPSPTTASPTRRPTPPPIGDKDETPPTSIPTTEAPTIPPAKMTAPVAPTDTDQLETPVPTSTISTASPAPTTESIIITTTNAQLTTTIDLWMEYTTSIMPADLIPEFEEITARHILASGSVNDTNANILEVTTSLQEQRQHVSASSGRNSNNNQRRTQLLRSMPQRALQQQEETIGSPLQVQLEVLALYPKDNNNSNAAAKTTQAIQFQIRNAFTDPDHIASYMEQLQQDPSSLLFFQRLQNVQLWLVDGVTPPTSAIQQQPPSAKSSSSANQLGLGTVLGIAVGGGTFLFLVIAALLIAQRRRQRQHHSSSNWTITMKKQQQHSQTTTPNVTDSSSGIHHVSPYATEINVVTNQNDEDDISTLGEPTVASRSVMGTTTTKTTGTSNNKNNVGPARNMDQNNDKRNGHADKKKDYGQSNTENNNNNNINSVAKVVDTDMDDDVKTTSITEDYDYTKAYLEKGDGVSLLSQVTDPSVAGRLGQEQQPTLTQQQTQKAAAANQETSLLRGMGLTERSLFSDDDLSFEELFLEDPNWTKFDVTAPPGKLGMVIDAVADTHGSSNNNTSGALMVHSIKANSVLAQQVKVGDRLLSLDGQDITHLSLWKVTQLIHSKAEQPERVFGFSRRTASSASVSSA